MINEPVLKKKNILNRILNNQILITCFTSILMIIVIVGSSYALFNKEAVLTNDVVVKSGSLEVVISNTTDRIEVDYTTLGVEDSVGLTYNPYSFSIENTGENDILYYEVRIVDKEHEISTLPHKSLNFSIQKDNGGYSSPVNLGDNGSYIAGDFNLSVGEKHLYDLKLWINTEYGEYANNKTLNASIEVILYSDLPLKNNIIYDSNGGSFVAKTNMNSDKISNIVPSMEGYDFGGWTSDPDSKVVEYKKGGEIDLSKGKILYAVWKARNVMNSFATAISSVDSSITKVFFIEDTDENIDTRYNVASIKADLTYNNQGRVLGWLETDPENSSYYHLYVGSNGTTYLLKGRQLFWNWQRLTEIKFNNIDTSMITDMSEMFADCTKLASLDLSSFDTSNVTTMFEMFSGCTVLNSLNISSFDTGNVTSMHSMFSYCDGLTSLNLSNFNTSKVATMYAMFQRCSGLLNLDLSNFDTSNVTTMENMFQECYYLESLNLSSFNTSKVTNMSSMFRKCASLEFLDVSSFDTSKVTTMSYMFALGYDFNSHFVITTLETLDLTNFDLSSLTITSYMFYDTGIKTIYSNIDWNNGKITSSSNMFGGDCYGLVGAIPHSESNANDITMANPTTGYFTPKTT